MSTKKKETSNGDHPTPDSTTKERASFCIGDEVLLQRKDGNFYLGTVVKIDLSRDQCLVKFDDNTESWSNFAKLTKLSTGVEIMCVKCKVSQTDVDNDIVVCFKCTRGYHQKCHQPPISDEFLKHDSKWECLKCSDKRMLPQRKSSIPAPVQPPPVPSPSQPPPKPPSNSKQTPLSSKQPLPSSKAHPPSTKSPPATITKPPPPSSKPPPPSTKSPPPSTKPPPPSSKQSPTNLKPSPPPDKTTPPAPQVGKPPAQVKSPSQPAKPPPPSTSKTTPQPGKSSISKALTSQQSPTSSQTLAKTTVEIQLKTAIVPPTPPPTPTEVSSASPVATEAQKKKLPYNMNDLHWDMQHRSNTENKYCYCGGPGKWFLKMLQCTRCRQWFHGRCLSSLRYPLYFGDRFYVFLCTLCNSGKEFLRRLEIKWVDLVHLAIFNLTLKTAKKYVDIDEEILKFINTSWNELQLPPKILETTSDSEKREIILSVLTSNRTRFKAAREVKSRKTKWGLRVRVPPPTPVFSLPPNKPLSDQVLSDAWNNSARLKFLPPPPRNSLPSKSGDDFDLSNLKDHLPGVEILHIETRLLVLPKGVPTSGHNVCIKSSTPIYPESRAIKRRIKEQGMESDRLRRSKKARRLRSSLNKDERQDGEERGELPPTPPSSESNPEAAPSAQPESSGDETSSRGTLDSIIPPPPDFSTMGSLFLPLQPVVARPVKRKLSEKDIIVTSTGEVKRRKIRRSRLLGNRVSGETGRGAGKKVKSSAGATTPTTSPVKSTPVSIEELKVSVNQYFGAAQRISSGEDFEVLAKRIGADGRTQYLINWGTPT